eukprot:15457475-Alexandrium_andersonii.AAC.1
MGSLEGPGSRDPGPSKLPILHRRSHRGPLPEPPTTNQQPLTNHPMTSRSRPPPATLRCPANSAELYAP